MVPRNRVGSQKALARLSNAFFLLMGAVLSVAAFGVVGISVCRSILCIWSGCDVLRELFNLVSYLVIAAAIFDVGRYLIEEEVLRDRELRSPEEARQSLTKFMVIIVIAVTLESLIAVIKASTGDLGNLLYPAALFVVAVLLLVGLGLYQRLSVLAETQVKAQRENR